MSPDTITITGLCSRLLVYGPGVRLQMPSYVIVRAKVRPSQIFRGQ